MKFKNKQTGAILEPKNEMVLEQLRKSEDYKVGNIREFGGELFRCVQDHTSQADWTPTAAASLWAKIGDPGEEWPAWSQPVGAHDAYNAGDKVSHNGKHWSSDLDANVWEPGVYGWTEQN